MPSNVIFYSDTPDGGTTVNLNQVNPDGSNGTLLASLGSNFQGVALNPAVKGQKVFGYSPSGGASPTYGIYSNTSISGTGATTIVSPQYSFIASIQVSSDGNFVYFVASIGLADTQLFKVAITGGTVTALDNAYTAHVRDAGDMVVYDKIPNGGVTSEVFMRSTALVASPTQLTTDNNNNYEYPQWSKDASKIVLASDKDDAQFEVYVTTPTVGGALTQISNAPTVNKSAGVTFSADGTMAAFVGIGTTDTTLSGIYRTGIIGASGGPTQTQIVTDALVESGIYWTGSNGRARGSVSAFLARRKHHGLLP